MVDLPFQDSPETADTRGIVLGEIERVQGLFQANETFDWWGRAHWVDRVRCLVLKASDVEGFAGAETLPLTEQTEDLLSFYGGDGRSLGAIDVVDVFAWLVSETLAKHTWLPSATQTLNLVMVQPLVNPASAPLLWVALNATLQDADGPDLMDVMRPMVFDMSTYPKSTRGAASVVREAQAEFFRRWSPGLLPVDWPSLDDQSWTEACNQLVAEARYGIESNVFELITRRAAAIRAGLRPR